MQDPKALIYFVDTEKLFTARFDFNIGKIAAFSWLELQFGDRAIFVEWL